MRIAKILTGLPYLVVMAIGSRTTHTTGCFLGTLVVLSSMSVIPFAGQWLGGRDGLMVGLVAFSILGIAWIIGAGLTDPTERQYGAQ